MRREDKMKKWVIVVIIVSILVIVITGWYLLQKSVKCLYRPEPYDQSPLKPIKPYTILTYNIQKFPFSLKSFDAVVDLFRQHHIILLQECFDDTLDPLIRIFPEYQIYRGTLQGINLMNSGLAVLSRFPILDGEYIQFNNFNSMTFDALSEKGFLSVVLDIDGKRVRVINTHLQSCDFERFDPSAMLQLDELLRYLSIHLKEKYFMMGGDFNVDVTDLKEYYEIAETTLKAPEVPTIFINFTTSHTRCTKKLGYDGLIFDYFITSKSVEMRPPKVLDCDYSDHNAVSTSFDLKN